MKSRLSKGGALVVVLISALVLVILGVGFITFSKMFGGGREMQNAADSGALNAAKTALIRPGVNATAGSEEEQFLGFTPKDKKQGDPDFSLGNINKIWGQALLVSLNEKAMEIEGSAGTDADSHSNIVATTAKSINDRLAAKLRPVNNKPVTELQAAFLDSSNSNTLRMISSNVNDKLQISDGAKVGFQDAGGPANIALNIKDGSAKSILKDIVDPGDAVAKAALTTALGSLASGAGTTPAPGLDSQVGDADALAVKGYTDLTIDGKKFYFVPLRGLAKPHMLSGTEFSSTAPQLATTSDPVNNSFLTKGKMKEEHSNNMLDFASIALAEPVDPAEKLSIPHGYVKIKNWKGFDLSESPVLHAHTSNDQNAANDDIRGIHSAEYANHQLLMARSGFAGPNHATDIFQESMDTPFVGLVGQDGKALLNADGDPVFGKQPQVQQLKDNNKAGNFITDPADRTCGGAFATDLPATGPLSNCNDILEGVGEPATVTVSVDGNGDITTTDSSNNTISKALAEYFSTKLLNQDETAFGSDIHPHIWSIDPKHAELHNNPQKFMNTADTDGDPYGLMYTGMLLMPNYGGANGNHHGRNNAGQSGSHEAPNQTQSPIVFGKAGTLWQYLQDENPGGGANPQTQILSRITQRILEIQPSFDSSNLQSVLSQVSINMKQDAYIFLGDNNQMTMAVTKADTTQPPTDDPNTTGDESKPLPTWLKAEADKLLSQGNEPDGKGLLGKTTFYSVARPITSQPQGDSFVENVAGDWNYQIPYENADNVGGAQMVVIMLSNKYVFRPCTGYQGQLAVLELKSFIHHGACPVDYTASPAVTPEQCPCVTFPPDSFPASPVPTPNTPNGWNQGTDPTDTGLPNCSHTGAC